MTSPSSAEFVTRHEFEVAMARIDGRFDRLEAHIDAGFARIGVRFAEFDAHFAHIDTRSAQVDVRSAQLQGSLEAQIERALASSIRWTVGTAFGLYALMFGLILFAISRELPHS